MALTTFSGPVRSINGFIGPIVSAAPVPVTTATITLTQTADAGATILLAAPAGVTATLPAATGTGSVYTLIQSVDLTSNNMIIKVANSSDIMAGFAMQTGANGDAPIGMHTGATSDTITLNASTTGGFVGDTITLTDIATNLWAVNIISQVIGVNATPFSATV